MKNKYFELYVSSQNEVKKSICEKYWEITEEGYYIYSIKQLTKKFKLTTEKLIWIIKSNSYIEICCDNCSKIESHLQLREELTGDPEKINLGLFKSCLCNDCRDKTEKEKEKEKLRELYREMELAFEAKKWEELDKRSLQTLLIICNSKTRNQMFTNLFNEATLYNELKKTVFNRLNTLNSISLIYVEHEIKGIKKIHTIRKLREKIKTTYSNKIILINKGNQEKKKLKLMKLAYDNKEWKNLNEMQLEKLIIISESKTTSEVIKKIFYGNDPRGDYAQKIWRNELNKLEELNLLWVIRSKNGGKILSFYVIEELVNELKTTYPDLFLDEQKKVNELKSNNPSFSTSFLKKINKKN